MECLTDDAHQEHLLLQQAFTQWANRRVDVGFPRKFALERAFRVWRVVATGRRYYQRRKCLVQEIWYKWRLLALPNFR
jgi:hypothetical protein